MYLKSIEIQGFKSFATKIRFEFHNGITAIVGPNGSGKSNVADAVRWVLGEQRVRQLRGHSMQDVIFAGTELRKPLGSAYVAITLDNSDGKLPIAYEEVTVARRIYRSGESEYLLNGSVCRLRDVQELFYDTGIGKEGYSIIGQGQIDKILSDKPEDRRELFDEAAGIVKFKRRKDTSLKKLASERDNLTRVSDILQELERQIPSLEKQSEKARIWLRLRDELRSLDVNAFLLENEKSVTELSDLEHKEEIAASELAQAREEREAAATRSEERETALAELERQIEDLRSRITGASVIRSRLEGDCKVLEEQIRGSLQNEEHFRERLSSVEGELGRRQEELDSLLHGKNTVDEQVAQLRHSREEAQALLGTTEEEIRTLSETLEQGRQEVLDIVSRRATIRSRLASLETRATQLTEQRIEVQQRMQDLQSSEDLQKQKITELREEFVRIGDRIRENEAERGQIEEQIAGMKERLGAEDAELREAQLRYHQDKSRLEALINLAERYEGFGGSVRRVMNEKKRDRRVIGVVADLLKTDKRYETAIETALGGSIQNIVTEDEATAKSMIELLKREKAGRATFLPLTSLKDPQPLRQKQILGEPGIIGTADRLVRTDERYRSVAENLLGRIVVADTFDHAAAAAARYGQSVRMVTLEGELFAPGGAISGGAFKNNSNLLGRRREMEELRRRVSEDEEQIRAHEQAIEDTKQERNVLRTRLEEGRTAQQKLFLEQNTVRVNIQTEIEKQEQSSGSAEELEREIERLAAELTQTRQEMNAQAGELTGSEEREAAVSAANADAETQLSALREKESEQAAAAARWDVEIEKIAQQQSFEEQNILRLRDEVGRYALEQKELTEGIAQSGLDREEKNGRLQMLRERIESADSQKEDGSRELTALGDEKARLQALQKEDASHREELATRIAGLDKECFRLSSRRERVQESVDEQVAYMWEEYELTLSQARELRDETMGELPALKREITARKNQIKELGSVNVGAVEEYKELMERYTFLRTQHDDLTEAAAALEKIIADLDESMRRQFREQFERIMKEFDKVFKIMFGGGTGRLELMEGEDLLEAGVRVIAQPPGKKLQNMMQLSGGEKSLTAIALLFAIQNLKPSPFCLLDEIEAALDESNVLRFAEYLHKLTEHTQFIVITHRRGTMEEADRLYGITMQEKGVSALVSVDLIDEDMDVTVFPGRDNAGSRE